MRMIFLCDVVCQYTLNDKDEIIFVNDGWYQTAILGGAINLSSNQILNRSLWDFISDDSTRFIYREILRKVRTGRNMNFNIRCDCEKFKRLLNVNITKEKNNCVKFETFVREAEARETKARLRQTVFDGKTSPSKELLIICSWCNRINTGGEIWLGIEDAIIDLSLFETEDYPMLSHGICYDCYQAVSEIAR